VASFCEHGSEPLGYTKGEEFDYLGDYQVVKNSGPYC
jgi:hypothetical protein